MSIKNDPAALRALVARQLQNGALSARESQALIKEITKDGVTPEEALALVESLTPAEGAPPTSEFHNKSVNRVMGRIDGITPLPLDRTNAPTLPNGALNYAAMLATRGQQGSVTPPLAHKSFGGQPVSLESSGKVFVGTKAVPLAVSPTATDATLEALWGLAKPGQLKDVPAATLNALNAQLVASALAGLATPLTDPGKFGRLAGVGAAISVLVQSAAKWDAATINGMLDLSKKVQSPMMQALIIRGLDASPMDTDQKARRATITPPEKVLELQQKFDAVLAETGQVNFTNVTGPSAQLSLSSIMLSKSPEGVTSFFDGLKFFDGINNGAFLDAEELSTARAKLEQYIQDSEQPAFVFGAFVSEAPKAAAQVVSARLVKQVEPELKATPPALRGFPLTTEQAALILKVLPNTRDATAIEQMVKCLHLANATFSSSLPSEWSTPTNPSAPMKPAAFKLFERAVSDYQEQVAAKADGKLEYSDLLREFRSTVQDVQSVVGPRMAELGQTPPRFNGIALAPEAAGYLRTLFETRMRSGASVENVGRALAIFAQANGGAVQGAAFTSFKAMMDDYVAQFPAYDFLEFNKLERMATSKVAGRPVPLCRINGQVVNMAEFYNKVGTQVASVVDRSKLLHDWQADRWGFRARASVELLDVVAEQTARGEGPVALLKRDNPGKTIEIVATGSDSGHEQFIYVVKQGTQEAARYTQGSDGALSRYNQTAEPVLFTAAVGQDGDLNVNVPTAISSRRYPLQTNYGVGDKIDLTYLDSTSVELAKEGETFSTRYKVVEATINGFDANGNYKVTLTTPQGQQVDKTVTINEIRRANNPHYFQPKGDEFSDVTINIQTDHDLKAFVDGAQGIINRYLPVDGSAVTLSSKDLAKRQKACIDAMMTYCAHAVKYPAEKNANPDPQSAKYYELTEDSWTGVPLGELVKIERGVCRHMCILQHLLLQYAGIDSRLASGAANTSAGAFRGFHIWVEASLADNARYLSDQTWNDRAIPLWAGAYSTDKRRVEMHDRTARYSENVVA